MNYEKATTEELIEYVAEKQMEILRPILHGFAKNCEKNDTETTKKLKNPGK